MDLDALGGNSFGFEFASDRPGSPFAEIVVIGFASAAIGMAIHLYLGFRMFSEEL